MAFDGARPKFYDQPRVSLNHLELRRWLYHRIPKAMREKRQRDRDAFWAVFKEIEIGIGVSINRSISSRPQDEIDCMVDEELNEFLSDGSTFFDQMFGYGIDVQGESTKLRRCRLLFSLEGTIIPQIYCGDGGGNYKVWLPTNAVLTPNAWQKVWVELAHT